MGLFERRERPAHQDPLFRAGVAELLGGAPDFDEQEVGLRIAGLAAQIVERLDGVCPDLGVARALFGDVARVGEGRKRRGDAEDADVVRHLQLRQRLHGRRLPDRVADPHAGHAVRLGEGPGHEDVGRLQRERDRALIRGIGHVVVVGLVDQNHRVGR